MPRGIKLQKITLDKYQINTKKTNKLPYSQTFRVRKRNIKTKYTHQL